MGVPSFNDLKLWVGTLFTKDDWDYNFRKIAGWFSDGNADLVVNSVKTSNGLDLDGAQISNLAPATSGDQAVNYDQALSILNRSSYYYPFSVASGKVDNNGNSAYLEKKSDSQIAVLAGNTNPDLVCIMSDATIETVTSDTLLTVTTTSTATFNLVKEKGQAITLTAGKVSQGQAPHTSLSPTVGDYYCETSVVPFKGWKYTAEGWENVEFCHIGIVEVADNDYTYQTMTYSNNNFDNLIVESKVNGANGYTIYANGYCEQWGFIAPSSSGANTINLTVEMADENYSIRACRQKTTAGGTFYDLYVEGTPTSTSFVIYNYAGSEGLYWHISGYAK